MLDLYTALAEPSRRQLLDRLLDAEASVTDLIDAVGLSQTATSKHLRVLRECGLVRVRVDGQRRIYGVDPMPLRELDDWLDRYRARWNRHVDDLTEHLDSRDPKEPACDADRSADLPARRDHPRPSRQGLDPRAYPPDRSSP